MRPNDRARHVVVASFTAETQHQRRTVPTGAELFTLYVRRRRRRLTKGTPGRAGQHVAGAGVNTEAPIDVLFSRLTTLIANGLQTESKSYIDYRMLSMLMCFILF